MTPKDMEILKHSIEITYTGKAIHPPGKCALCDAWPGFKAELDAQNAIDEAEVKLIVDWGNNLKGFEA